MGEEMTALAAWIRDASQARAASLKATKEETRLCLESARRLLADVARVRQEGAAARRHERVAQVQRLRRTASEQRAAARGLIATVADEHRESTRTRSEAKIYALRDLHRASVAVRSEVSSWLSEIREARADQERSVRTMRHRTLGHLNEFTKRRRGAVQRWLDEARDARTAGNRAERERRRQRIASLHQSAREERDAIQEWLAELARTRTAQRDTQTATATVAEEAAELENTVEPETPVETPPAEEAEAVQAELDATVTETDTVGESPTEEVSSGSEPESLAERIFAFLVEHPDGVRLTEIETKFELGRLQAARLVNGMIEDGKVRKRDLFYFAI